MRFYILRQNIVYLATFTICLAISALVSWRVYEWQKNFNYENFRHITRENTIFIKKSVEWHEDDVRSIANYFLSSGEVTEEEFDSYTDYQLNSDSGYHAMGWINEIVLEDGQKKYIISHINYESEYVMQGIPSIENNNEFVKIIEQSKKFNGVMYSVEKDIISITDHNHLMVIRPAFKGQEIYGYAFGIIDPKQMIEETTGEEENAYFHYRTGRKFFRRNSPRAYHKINQSTYGGRETIKLRQRA